MIGVVLSFYVGLQAEEKVFFYAPSSTTLEQQWTFYQSHFSPYRKIISLNGSYELWDFPASKKLADVHIPAIYYQKIPLPSVEISVCRLENLQTIFSILIN